MIQTAKFTYQPRNMLLRSEPYCLWW